jgi:poly-beta-hydroxyalkanoate depolymerase
MATTSERAGQATSPLLQLARHGTVNAGHSLAEIGRAAGTTWAGTVAGLGNPFGLATRGMLWWHTMTDRRRPGWHLANEIVLSTPFAHLRDFSDADGRGDRRTAARDADVVPTLVLPPQAGHSSTVVDFSPAQSQVAVIRAAGLTRTYVLEWRPATAATRDVTITDYLAVIDRSVETAGGRVNLVGDCQGGWLAAVYAALHPDRVHTLTLAGAPIDFHAGESVIAASTLALTRAFGLAPYRALVRLGGGNMPGRAVLGNFIGIQPQAELARQLQLLDNIGDPAHVARYRVFEDWFKHTQDIPGAFYLWLVEHLFQRNELISGRLVVDGRRADLADITCPLFLLAGSTDHITPPAQLFAAADAVGTPREQVTTRVANGGHLGLFMGRDALREDWPAMMAAVYAVSVPGGGTGPGPAGRAVADPGDSPRVPAP